MFDKYVRHHAVDLSTLSPLTARSVASRSSRVTIALQRQSPSCTAVPVAARWCPTEGSKDIALPRRQVMMI